MRTYKDTQLDVLRILLHVLIDDVYANQEKTDAVLTAACALADFYSGVTVFTSKSEVQTT